MGRSSAEHRLALRGVYEEPYRVNGHRVFYAVDSRGEQIGLRTLAPGASKKEVEEASGALWDDLDRDDPITPADASLARAFRLIRGGLGVVCLALLEARAPGVSHSPDVRRIPPHLTLQ